VVLVVAIAIAFAIAGTFLIGYLFRVKGGELAPISIIFLLIGAIFGITTALSNTSNLELVEVESSSANLLPITSDGLYVEVYINPDGSGYLIYRVDSDDNFSKINFSNYSLHPRPEGEISPTIRRYFGRPKDPWYWIYALPIFPRWIVLSTPEKGMRFNSIQDPTGR